MGAILFSRHPRSRIEIGLAKKNKQEIRLENSSTYNYLNLNKTGWEHSAMILRSSYMFHAKFCTDFEKFLLRLTYTFR